MSQLPQLATKIDIANLRTDIAEQETRLMKWIVGIIGFLLAGVVIAGVGIVIQIMLSPGVAQ